MDFFFIQIMTENIAELNEKTFSSFIKKGNVVIDMHAEWCGPCKIMAPEFEKAAKEIKGIKFGKVDVDQNQEIAMTYGVMSIPTTLFFKDGEQVDRHSGALYFKDIKKLCENNF